MGVYHSGERSAGFQTQDRVSCLKWPVPGNPVNASISILNWWHFGHAPTLLFIFVYLLCVHMYHRLCECIHMRVMEHRWGSQRAIFLSSLLLPCEPWQSDTVWAISLARGHCFACHHIAGGRTVAAVRAVLGLWAGQGVRSLMEIHQYRHRWVWLQGWTMLLTSWMWWWLRRPIPGKLRGHRLTRCKQAALWFTDSLSTFATLGAGSWSRVF